MTDQRLSIQQLPINAFYALHRKIISAQPPRTGQDTRLFSGLLGLQPGTGRRTSRPRSTGSQNCRSPLVESDRKSGV